MRRRPDPVAFHELLTGLLGDDKDAYLDQAGLGSAGTFRFNPLKHTREFQEHVLAGQGFQWGSRPGDVEAERLEQRPFALGQSLAHVLGHIYIQDLASMVPVWALRPQPGEKVLDLCAAPGSKTTQIAAAMKNRGVLVANDVSTRRTKVLVANLHRTGVVNTGVRRAFGEQYGNQFFEVFDRVLLDPPCTALGTIRKSPEVMERWNPEATARLALVQRNLLASGLKALRPGGVLVYSTCTMTPDENEQVIDWALRQFPVDLEEIPVSGVGSRPALKGWKGSSFHAGLERALRLYPFDQGCEGFFVARLRKLASFGAGRGERPQAQWRIQAASGVEHELERLQEGFGSRFPYDEFGFRRAGELYVTSGDWVGFGADAEVRTVGLPLAHRYREQLRLTTEACHLLSDSITAGTVDLQDWRQLLDFCDRRDLACGAAPSRQVAVRFRGQVIGHGLVQQGSLISRFPRTGWTFRHSDT